VTGTASGFAAMVFQISSARRILSSTFRFQDVVQHSSAHVRILHPHPRSRLRACPGCRLVRLIADLMRILWVAQWFPPDLGALPARITEMSRVWIG